ncbi:MAG: hypothetical protein M3499_08670 [Actinomycetota bacterium]|nr:hypothetical protein [Actinomycetota bacterium]
MTETEIRVALREWVREQAGDEAPLIDDATPLIASRLITSLQVMDLLLLLEELRQEPIDPTALRPGAFRDIDAIYATFFAEPATDVAP